jgi:hypothetical protein
MRSIRWAALGCALLLWAAPARAGDKGLYADGDIEVMVDFDSNSTGSHGYTAYPVLIVNHSKDRAHRVTLKLPADSYGYSGDVLRSLTKTVEMPASSKARIRLLQPPYPPIQGNNLEVRVDGKGSDRKLQLNTAGPSSGAYAMRGGYYSMSRSSGPAEPLIFYSQSVALTGPGMPHGVMPGAGGTFFLAALGGNVKLLRADGPLDGWPTEWLAYSRYDGIVITADEWTKGQPGVNTALLQYAETGGTLILVGKDATALPASWTRRPPDRDHGMSIYTAGFGRCIVCPEEVRPGLGLTVADERLAVVATLCNEGANAWRNVLSAADANRQFRVVEEAGVPVRGLFVLMLLFAITIGPVNLWLLGRKDRRIWMLWTVPTISGATCLAVFGYMLISEGWNGHLRTEAITLLDETTQRATTYGWTAFYAPLTPGDGLHFTPNTELMWQKSLDFYYRNPGGNACSIDWTKDQHLDSGWVSARVPSHFRLRKSESRPERLRVTRGKEGSLLVSSALGANLKSLWLADKEGNVYSAEDVPTDSQVALTRNKDVRPVQKAFTLPRALLTSNGWLTGGEVPPSPPGSFGGGGPFVATRPAMPTATMKAGPPPGPGGPGGPGRVPPPPTPPEYTGSPDPVKQPVRFLAPLIYVAVIEGSCPFVEDGLQNAKFREYRSIVIGTLKEPDDAN